MAHLSGRRRLPRVGLGGNRTLLTLGDPGAVNPDTLCSFQRTTYPPFGGRLGREGSWRGEGGGGGRGGRLGGGGAPGGAIWGVHTPKAKCWSITGSPYLPLPAL